SRRTLGRLRGTRRAQLYAVRANVAALAKGRLLNAARAPLAFLTLERNRAWWAAGPLLPAGRRVEFPGSELVWQMYPGQGLQVQWLGTFGKANGLYGAGSYDRLRALLDEALALAAPRAGGIAFEYQFRFGGGLPPWASGMAQATAVQALSRAASRLKAPAYFDAARAALGIFRTDPPDGVRIPTAAGAHYLIYSFAPGLRVLNAVTQTLNGLHDFAVLSGDPEGRALFDAGDAELRATLAGWDTGAWSLYSLGGRESDLGYHRLARDFLDGLCDRLETDGARGRSYPDPGPYCAAAGRFTDYLVEPPALRVPDARPRTGRRTRVRFSVSKISTVTVTMRRRGRVAFSTTLRVGRGSHYVTIVPQKRGPLEVDVRAVDLAGNAASADGTLRVRPAPKRRG
ncbi:MAG TPA: D-glucuronyl C5-epimerase family protein, partial [Solirubrobacteraceae bacterium]|nr:D-glucuronyl C5-epimerase family protein [Solirubrobacteraceae bacterium]